MSPGSVVLAFMLWSKTGRLILSCFASAWDQGVRVATYAVQEDADLAACVDSRLFAAQLADFAEDADGLVGELLEVGSGDAGGCFGHCGCVSLWSVE